MAIHSMSDAVVVEARFTRRFGTSLQRHTRASRLGLRLGTSRLLHLGEFGGEAVGPIVCAKTTAQAFCIEPYLLAHLVFEVLQGRDEGRVALSFTNQFAPNIKVIKKLVHASSGAVARFGQCVGHVQTGTPPTFGQNVHDGRIGG